jgi:hypothetical protein
MQLSYRGLPGPSRPYTKRIHDRKATDMILIQVVPNGKNDAYKLLRDKVNHEAATWSWKNKARTRLVHSNIDGYIDVDSADGVVIARVFPKTKDYEYYLVEKLMGRLIAWFPNDLAAIDIQFLVDVPSGTAKKKAR